MTTGAVPGPGQDEVDVDGMLDQWDSEQAQKGKFLAKAEGEFDFRILPPATRGYVFHGFGKHYNLDLIGPGFSDDYRSAGCYELTLQQECPFCQIVNGLYFEAKNPDGSRNQATVNKANALRKKKRFAINILVAEQIGQGVQVYEYGPDTQGLIVPLFKEYQLLASPEQGHWCRVKFGKSGDYITMTSCVPRRQPTKLEVQGWREGRKDLAAYARASLIPLEKIKELIAKGGMRPAINTGGAAGSVQAPAGGINLGGDVAGPVGVVDGEPPALSSAAQPSPTTATAAPAVDVGNGEPKPVGEALGQASEADLAYLNNPAVQAVIKDLQSATAKKDAPAS